MLGQNSLKYITEALGTGSFSTKVDSMVYYYNRGEGSPAGFQPGGGATTTFQSLYLSIYMYYIRTVGAALTTREKERERKKLQLNLVLVIGP